MKRVPALLAIGFVLITFFRVSDFLSKGMRLGWLGISFAIALTAGVYTSAYFTQHRETKWAAFCTLVVFAIADLWFNELEMVRSLAPEQLIVSGANFLGFSADSITRGMHVSALVYGALPTINAALLGWLQAKAEKVAILNRKGFVAQILSATRATFAKGIRASLENYFGKENFAQLSSGNSGNQPLLSTDEETVAGNIGKIRWEDLKVSDKEEIAVLSPRQILGKFPGISARTARNWKQWVKDGK